MNIVTIAVVVGIAMTLGWLGCGAAAAVMARRRGGATAPWILLGALLGPVGIYLIVKVMHHQCDACKKPVLRGVRQCPGCGDDIARLEHNPVGPMWTYRRDW
ncbi:MAG: hypothetical protein CME20_17595 [Gemmatimonadetes bacterium]|nr:hypothetical protein [Gemmatimonadota bacterium]